jgi:hypothetical protein
VGSDLSKRSTIRVHCRRCPAPRADAKHVGCGRGFRLHRRLELGSAASALIIIIVIVIVIIIIIIISSGSSGGSSKYARMPLPEQRQMVAVSCGQLL